MPEILVNILKESGYETSLAIEQLNAENITDLEKFVNDNLCHLLRNSLYENKPRNKLNVFRFLPGHRTILLHLPSQITEFNHARSSSLMEKKWNLSEFSFILKSLIETAQSNTNKNPTVYRYSETIRHFSTYIYLMCGKACYETLSGNLPIPQACTICEYSYNTNLR